MTKISKTAEVKKYIIANIESGIYGIGQMIESELALSKKFGVSRLTVREALRDLVEGKVLQKQQGRGTFVLKQPQFKGFQCGIGFSAEMSRHNMIPSAKNVRVESAIASIQVQEELKLSEGSEIWFVSRLRLANHQPIAVEQEFFSKAIVPFLSTEIAKHSIYGYLQEQGISFSYVDQMIDAVAATEEIAKQLEVPIGEPLIQMYLVAYLENGTPFNCGTTYYRTDTYKLLQTVYQK